MWLQQPCSSLHSLYTKGKEGEGSCERGRTGQCKLSEGVLFWGGGLARGLYRPRPP